MKVTRTGFAQICNIEVFPFTGGPDGEGPLFLILFESGSRPSAVPVYEDNERRRRARAAGRTTSDGPRLSASWWPPDYLQSIIEEQGRTNEELRSANEEILSGNEELHRTNEELETAKEELQSTNEELTTLNEELKHRNQELGPDEQRPFERVD